MLEMAVSLQRSGDLGDIGSKGETDLKKIGDVLVMKKSPAIWSEMERKFFLITVLNDPVLEMEMGSREVWSLPFIRQTHTIIDGEEDFKIEAISSFRVDINLFTGTTGLDPSIAVAEPTTPSTGPELLLTDLVEDDIDPNDNATILLDCTGKKSELSCQLLPSLDVVSRAVFKKGNKVWNHGHEIPSDYGVMYDDISLDEFGPGILDFPGALEIVQAGLGWAKGKNVKHVILGIVQDIPGVMTSMLKYGLRPHRPLLGKTTQEVLDLVDANSIEYDDIQIDVGGTIINHSLVRRNI
jgi:hypothetical protein